jgi:hypothetical protein
MFDKEVQVIVAYFEAAKSGRIANHSTDRTAKRWYSVVVTVPDFHRTDSLGQKSLYPLDTHLNLSATALRRCLGPQHIPFLPFLILTISMQS